MSVRLVLGRSGSGKTHYCAEAMLAEIAAGPRSAARCILLVPEQATFQMEREIAGRAPGGGFAGAEVLSFKRLATRVFEVTGGEPPLLTAQTRTLALRSIALQTPDALAAFGAAARREGFFRQLESVVDELLDEAVTPEALASAAERLKRPAARRRAAAIADLYARYLSWLGPDRADPAYRLAILRERLLAAPRLADARIWVDGFAGFTGQESETLVTLARLARRMEITLLCDPESPPGPGDDRLALFHRTNETYRLLCRRFTDEGISLEAPLHLTPPVAPRFSRVPAIAWLERRFADADLSNDEPPSGANSIAIVRCPSHLEEFRRAAATIRRSVIRSGGGLRFRDCAVIVRNLTPFAHDISNIFEEYGVPYFLDDRRPVAAHVIARFATALLEAARTDLSPEAALRLLRTQMLPAHREEIEDLEEAVLRWEIRGGARWMNDSWPGDRRESESMLAVRRRIAGAVQSLRRLMLPALTPTGRDWGRALFASMTALAAPKRVSAWIDAARERGDVVESEHHRMAWESLCAYLTDVDEILAETPMSIDEFSGILSSALSEMTFGVAPPTLDQVLIGSIDRSRQPELRFVWLAAMNEGIFPAPPAEDVLLLPDERSALTAAGLPAPKSNRDDVFGERLLGYIALTRASAQVTLSYATIGDDASELFPSPLVHEVIAALPDVKTITAGSDSAIPEIPTTLAEVGRGAMREMSPTARGLWAALEQRLRARPSISPDVEFLFRGRAYSNAAPDVEPPRRFEDLLWVGSPSELETHIQCPFQHFATTRLQLKSRRGPKPIDWSLGDAAHAILADVVQKVTAQDLTQLQESDWLTRLHDAISRYRERERESAPTNAHARFLTEVLESFLKEVVLVHAARWARGAYRPIATELRFGRDEFGDAIEPAILSTPAGSVGLRGSVDRVDALDAGGVRRIVIYDYKPGARKIISRFLTGHRLQAIAYSLVATDLLSTTAETVEWVAALIAPLYPECDVLERDYVSDLDADERRMMMYRPVGIIDERIWPDLDNGLEIGGRSAVAPIRRQKNGRLSGDVVSPKKLAEYGDAARATIGSTAESIAAGRVAIEPLIENQTLACARCDDRRLCRFETLFNTPRVAEVVLPQIHPDESAGEQS